MRNLFLVLVVAGAACRAAPALAGQFEVPFSVEEAAGVARRAEPISGGVPLPRGAGLKPGQAFAVFRKDGGELACQAVPLSVRPDGSLRWVLVDFQDDLAAGQTRQYLLRSVEKPGVLPDPRLEVRDGADAVTVDTGRVKFTVSKTKPFALFSSVESGGKPVVSGGAVTYRENFTGADCKAAVPASVTVEHAGSMRVTVAVKGGFTGDEKNRFLYSARITAWAGKSLVHVKYSICNSNESHYCYRLLESSRLTLKLAAVPSGTVLGAAAPLDAGADAWLLQGNLARAGGAAAASTGWKSEAGQTPGGWLAARTPAGTVLAADLYFADDPARKLEVAGGELVLHGVVERPECGDPKARPYLDRFRVLHDCSHLSSQYLIDFAAPDSAAAMADLARAGSERAWIRAAPESYFHHEDVTVHGLFGTQADEMACYDKWGWKYEKDGVPVKPRRSYPRYFRGIDNHFEPEEDIVDQLLIMYLRTGKRSYFKSCRSWANYWMDLYAWRTDGWRWKDGGVWWRGGPKGNQPQRPADPVTGVRDFIPSKGGNRSYNVGNRGASRQTPMDFTKSYMDDNYFLSNSKGCYCHNWAQGLAHWYLLTGDGDAKEACIDRVEQDADAMLRAKYCKPTNHYERQFTRSSFNAHSARFYFPDEEFVREKSEALAAVYFNRPVKEPRGLVNAALPKGLSKPLEWYVGEAGMKALEESGGKFDAKTGQMTDRDGREWCVIKQPALWMYPPQSAAMELYSRITGSEDAHDWVIAYGKAVAQVIYQRHGNFDYGRFVIDFPARGTAKDYGSWTTDPKKNPWAEGPEINSFLARFHPDVCARGYELCGEEILRKRAYDLLFGGTHRGYNAPKMKPLDRVGMWIDYYSDHDGQLDYMLKTFHVWAHERKDTQPPAAVKDLKVAVSGDRATVSFTAPADAGGGRVARYQVKCSGKPIVDYEKFLEAFNGFKEGECTNWWMAANLSGEPGSNGAGGKAPAAPGAAESFTVSGVPAGAKYFAVRAYDDSSNRGPLSNVTGP